MYYYYNYLFEDTGDKILGYVMSPKDNDIKKFKVRELESILNNSGILEAVSNCSTILQDAIEKDDESVSYYSLFEEGDGWGDRSFHTIQLDEDINRYKTTLDNYYNGEYYKCPSLKVRKRSFNKYLPTDYQILPTDYLLLTEDKYTQIDYFNTPTNYKMHGIIPITEQLYNLQQLENGRFDRFDFNNNVELLQLFSYGNEPNVIISKREFKDLLHCDLIQQDAYDDAIKKVNQSQKVLKLVRDYNIKK